MSEVKAPKTKHRSNAFGLTPDQLSIYRKLYDTKGCHVRFDGDEVWMRVLDWDYNPLVKVRRKVFMRAYSKGAFIRFDSKTLGVYFIAAEEPRIKRKKK